MHELSGHLDSASRRIRNTLLVRSLFISLFIFAPLITIMIYLDWVFRLPGTIRWLMLLMLVITVVKLYVSIIRPVMSFKPTRLMLAHRIEEMDPSLAGRLASAMDFTKSDHEHTEPGVRKLLEDMETLDKSTVDRLFKPGITSTWMVSLSSILICILLVVILNPQTTRTGIIRIIWPNTTTSWAPRTSVESMMSNGSTTIHGRGIPLYLRALNTTPGSISDDVTAVYRTRDHEGEWVEGRMVLTHQGDGVHERIIETTADEIEFSFHTDDANTTTEHISIIDLPSVTENTFEVDPPPWVNENPNVGTVRTIDPTTTMSEPVLHGSTITMDITTNRPVPAPSEDDRESWMYRTFGIDVDAHPDAHVRFPDTNTMQLKWTFSSTTQLIISPHDEHGLEANDPLIITIPGIDDLPPIVQLQTPVVDQTVLPTAVVQLNATASDDIELTSIGFELKNTNNDPEAPTAPDWQEQRDVSVRNATLSTELEMADIEAQPGSIYRIEAHANDRHPGEHSGTRRISSTHRNIQIVDKSRFLTMLRQRLKLLEQRVHILDDRQSLLLQASGTGVLTNEDKREQASISRAIQDQQEMLTSMNLEIEMNRTSDGQIQSLIRFTEDALKRALDASNSATSTIGSMEIDSTIRFQEDVRFELQEIASMLGDDEESWVISRRLEQLIETQTEIQRATAEEASISAGQDKSTMAPEQVSRLDAIAMDQLSLTNETRQFIDALQRKSETEETKEDTASDGIGSALEKSESLRLLDQVRESAELISDAKMESALSSQQQVLDILAEIKSDLNEGEEGIRELVRKLEELEKTIRRLVDFQTEERDALLVSIERNMYSRRDTSMLRLRKNTLSAAAEARRSGEGTRFASRPLEQAAGSQGRAITALRSQNIIGQIVLTHEENSLQTLSGLLEEIKELADEARRDEARGERNQLAAAYTEILEREDLLQDETRILMEKPRDRRTRFEGRRLGGVQEKIRIDLITLLDSTPELNESTIFRHAHKYIDLEAVNVTKQLQEKHPTPNTIAAQENVSSRLRNLVEALKPTTRKDGFTDASQSQSGSSSESDSNGPPSSVPPIAELRLLKSLQVGVLESTRRINERLVETNEIPPSGIDVISQQQHELLEIGIDMLQQLQPPQPGDEPPSTTPGVMPISTLQDDSGAPEKEPNSNQPTIDDGVWPDLDTLLDIDSDEEGGTESEQEQGDAESPLHAAIDQMRLAANNLDLSQYGLQTQRAQQSAIEQLNVLIDMAQQQSTSQSSQGSQGESPSPGAEPESSDSKQQQSQPDSGASGDGVSMPPPAMDPLLGGVLEESSSEWGALPSRVRDMLRQGRQENYSLIYERMTAEYYRRLAEEQKRD